MEGYILLNTEFNHFFKLSSTVGLLKMNNFAACMGQHTTNQADGVHLWMHLPEQTPKVVKDSITSYAGYFADSLNSSLTNKAFRFELKEIILPDEDAKSESIQTVYPSMLNPKGVNPGNISAANRNFPSFDWMTLLLILGLGFLAWVRFNFNRRLKQIFSATFARRFVGQLVRDGNLEKEGISLALGFISLFSYSTIFYGFAGEVIASHLTGGRLWAAFLLIAFAILLLRMTRRISVRFIGRAFRSSPATDVFQLNALLFSFTSGVLLFPIAMVWVFTNEPFLLYAGVAIMLITLVIRLFRNLISGLQAQSFSGFYIFLYFCTLEILPVAIGIKIYEILSW